MSTDYFSQLPKTSFKRANPNDVHPYEVTVSDIFIRFKMKDALISNASLFYPYQWKDHDTPQTVAYKYYGDSRYFWVVFFSNNAFDLNYDFPMTSPHLNRFVFLKYQNQAAAFYFPSDPTLFFAQTLDEQTTQTMNWASSTIKMYGIDDPEIIVDYDTWLAYTDTKREISYFTYEDELNESKRNVQLLDSAYLNKLVREFSTDLSQARAQAK